jgi:hypothetical protein
MEKTTLYLEGEDYRRLKRLAATRKVAPASLVREAVAEYVSRHARTRPLPRSLGAGDSGTTDLGERAEQLLAGLGGPRRPRSRRDRR